jgi:hypothetical protein
VVELLHGLVDERLSAQPSGGVDAVDHHRDVKRGHGAASPFGQGAGEVE